jgi:hypothetical protein
MRQTSFKGVSRITMEKKDTSSTSLHINIYFLTVADMCKSSSATEHSDHSGSYKVDSVVLHIMIQEWSECSVAELDLHISATVRK